MRVKALGVVWAVLWPLTGLAVRNADAAGTRNLADGWVLSPRAVAGVLTDARRPTGGQWVLLGQSQLYGVAELPVRALWTGGARIVGGCTVSGMVGWQTLGDAIWREDTWRWKLEFGRRVPVGIEWLSVSTRAAATGRLLASRRRRSRVDLTLAWRVMETEPVHLEAKLWLNVLDVSGSVRAAFARRPFARVQGWNRWFAYAAAIDLRADQSPTFGVEWGVRLGTVLTGVRLDPATGTLGPVLSWRYGRFLWRSSHLIHPALGVTHRVEIGWGNWQAASW